MNMIVSRISSGWNLFPSVEFLLFPGVDLQHSRSVAGEILPVSYLDQSSCYKEGSLRASVSCLCQHLEILRLTVDTSEAAPLKPRERRLCCRWMHRSWSCANLWTALFEFMPKPLSKNQCHGATGGRLYYPGRYHDVL